MDEEGVEPPRQYTLKPRLLLVGVAGSAALLALLLFALAMLTPLREFIPGYNAADIRQDARLNAVRLAALRDSLYAQQEYMEQLRQLMMGEIDTTFIASSAGASAPSAGADFGANDEGAYEVGPPSQNWVDHAQPALSVGRMPVQAEAPFRVVAAGQKYLSSLQFPVLPPVEGFATRGFDARTGHYAVDLAVEEGTMVRSIGDGYVVLSDWTHEGGFTIAVQHAEGYVSVYKHNQRLLKRVGDRVRAREAVAMSGNSGEISTGPHLHFELWLDGLAQDPVYYLVGF